MTARSHFIFVLSRKQMRGEHVVSTQLQTKAAHSSSEVYSSEDFIVSFLHDKYVHGELEEIDSEHTLPYSSVCGCICFPGLIAVLKYS